MAMRTSPRRAPEASRPSPRHDFPAKPSFASGVTHPVTSNTPEPPPRPVSKPVPWARWAAGALLFAICFRVLPPLWCGRDAGNWWRGDRQTQEALVRGVEQWIQQPLGTDRFKTGSSQFDGEYSDLNDRITAKLARVLAASPITMIETYPFETYPVDNRRHGYRLCLGSSGLCTHPAG
jgi:hypothetical protein